MNESEKRELLRRFAGIRLLSLDVDGVLTDGGLYYTEDGVLLRKFNVKDGQGIKQVLAAGVEVAIVSAGSAPTIRCRARDLGIAHVIVGTEDKLAALTGLCRRLGIGLAEVAHVGDDVNNLPVMEAVGVALSVADAMPQVLEAAAFVSLRGGGDGAVREICDLLVTARG